MALRLDDIAGAQAAAEEALWIISLEPGLALWWRAATTRYLRLPHASGVVLAMITITALSTLVLLFFSRGGSLFFED